MVDDEVPLLKKFCTYIAHYDSYFFYEITELNDVLVKQGYHDSFGCFIDKFLGDKLHFKKQTSCTAHLVQLQSQ